jgi:hypothetical protein
VVRPESIPVNTNKQHFLAGFFNALKRLTNQQAQIVLVFVHATPT